MFRWTAVLFVFCAIIATASAEEARHLMQIGNEICADEHDFDRFWKESIDGTAAHKRGYRVPASCIMVMNPAKAFVLDRPTENKTKIRVLDGELHGRVGWTDAYLPKAP